MTCTAALARIAAAFALAVALLGACSQESAAPERPAGLPADAVWVGGADGGVYVALEPRAAARRFDARVFHQNGDVWYEGPLVLEPADAEPVDAARPELFEGWDGEALHVAGGRRLHAPVPP